MACLITGGPSPPPPPRSMEGSGGAVIIHMRARKNQSHTLDLPFPMQDDGREAMRKASTGYIPPCREGERGELADSETYSLLYHLLLEPYDCMPAIAQGLWKSHNLVPIQPGWSFSGLYLALLGRKGMLLVVTSTKTCDSISNSI